MAKSVINLTPGEREEPVVVDGVEYPGRMPLSNIEILSNEQLVHDPSKNGEALPVERFDIKHNGKRYVDCIPYLQLKYQGPWSVYHCTVEYIEDLDTPNKDC